MRRDILLVVDSSLKDQEEDAHYRLVCYHSSFPGHRIRKKSGEDKHHLTFHEIAVDFSDAAANGLACVSSVLKQDRICDRVCRESDDYDVNCGNTSRFIRPPESLVGKVDLYSKPINESLPKESYLCPLRY